MSSRYEDMIAEANQWSSSITTSTGYFEDRCEDIAKKELEANVKENEQKIAELSKLVNVLMAEREVQNKKIKDRNESYSDRNPIEDLEV